MFSEFKKLASTGVIVKTVKTNNPVSDVILGSAPTRESGVLPRTYPVRQKPGAEKADAIIRKDIFGNPESWWKGNPGTTVIKYNFFKTLPAYYSPYDAQAAGFKPFNDAMKIAAKDLLKSIETFANVKFVEVADARNADIGFGRTSDTGSGYAYYPNHPGVTPLKSGDVWLGSTSPLFLDMHKGSGGYEILAHEIGHAMGLQHTFDGGLTGVEDTTQYSVMAYGQGSARLSAESYMPYDIKALQTMYDVNTSYRTGNDTYNLAPGKLYTIWDAGGTDMLDGSKWLAPMTIDLAQGGFSYVGNGPYDSSFVPTIAIAYGANIENARGSGLGDVIYGNDLNNTIYGNSGNDDIYGRGGNDTLYGDLGMDRLYGENGNDILYGDYGRDRLDGGAGADTLTGGRDSDVFAFTAKDGQRDTITDFTKSGTERDYIDISDVLEGFDKGIDKITDFVRFVTVLRGPGLLKPDTDIMINADGHGNDWKALATLKGAFGGMTPDSLLNSGQLIVDKNTFIV